MPNQCAVCGTINSYTFSEDFPDRFKVCCICHFIVCHVLKQESRSLGIEGSSEHIEDCVDCQLILKKYKEKILKLFTLGD